MDDESANACGWYRTKAAALKDVRETAERYGADAVEVLTLALTNLDDDDPPLRGAELVAAALTERT